MATSSCVTRVCTLTPAVPHDLFRSPDCGLRVELPLTTYNAPGTTDLGYDLYMAPAKFEDFVATLLPASTVDGGAGGLLRVTEYHAVRHRGMRFALLVIALMFGGLLFLGGVAFLLAELFPELEEDATMALVFLIPPMSFGILWTIIKSKGRSYRIQLSPGEITIRCVGKPAPVSIKLSDATVLPVNWVATGRYGRRPTGPGLEFLYGTQKRTRIALTDADDMWGKKTPEISEPHFVISRQAWDELRALISL